MNSLPLSTPLFVIAALTVVAVSAPGCGDSDAPQGAGDILERLELPDVVPFTEVAAPEDTPAPEPDVAGPVDVAPEVVSDPPDGVDGDVAPLVDGSEPEVVDGPEPGTLGAPCTTSETCFSGHCMPSADGMVCSKSCLETCPDGWSCQSITGPSGAPAYVCVQPTALLCQPCVDHKDCNQAIAAGTNLCVSHGDAGSFCGVACSDDDACLADYVCDLVPAPGGGTTGQCVPADGGECACNGIGTQLELQTGCGFTNDMGNCSGSRGCTPEGLSACSAQPATDEICNGVDDDCDGEMDEDTAGSPCEVQSGAGTCPGFEVCSQGQIVCQGSPPIDEICNGVDDDCDGTLDEGFPDNEGDGLADCSDPDDDNDGVDDIFDCEPLDPAVSPDHDEICNGFDDDCDNDVDEKNAEGCVVFWQDIDQDLFGSMAAPSRCLCAKDHAAFYTVLDGVQVLDGVVEPSDCADLVAEINPSVGEHEGAVESCGGVNPDCLCDGVDNDCDALIDEGFDDADGDGKPYCTDNDDDGDGTPDVTDCEPDDPTIHANATEWCNEIDDNCDGVTDEEDAVGCVSYYQDVDSDDHGSWTVAPRCLCKPDQGLLFTALEAGDCNDLDANVFFGAVEVCNGIDDTCDGFTDEWFDDWDVDGSADCVDPDDDDDGAPDDVDCAPYDPFQTPGKVEVCNGIDDNCVDGVDEAGSLGCFNYWLDVDGDDMGSDLHPPQCLCEPDPITHYTAEEGGDCNDSNAYVFEGALEICNVIDDNCDGNIDEGVSSPCGDCSSVCILQMGIDGIVPFVLGASEGVLLTEDGALTLVDVPGDGTYTHTLEGWQDAPTLWDRLWLEVEVPDTGGAAVAVRYRTAASVLELDVAEWEGPFGPFATGVLPVEINQVAAFLQVELRLISSNINANPLLRGVSFIAWKQ